MKKTVLLILCLLTIGMAKAQKNNFSYKFYGFVRGDFYYNSRNNAEAVDGTFYLYPLNKDLDPDGKDLNANSNSSFYSFVTRLGLDMTGPNIGTAKSSAKIETDFGGFAQAYYLLRIRHAYVKLDWEQGSSLLLGQTWHPLFGNVMPEIINLCTGGPFQPFNRSPMARYQYNTGNITLTGAAVYQFMYTSAGPNGKSEEYQKYGNTPELYAGISYKNNGFVAGAGVEMFSIKPRIRSTVTNAENETFTYKVNERVTSFSYMAEAQYTTGDLTVGAKTLIASNLGHTTLLGGFGVSAVDSRTGEREYTSLRHSTSWVNAVYGKKWRGGVFGGYSKNLGSGKELLNTSDFYGTGVDIDQLLTCMGHVSYNLPHWKAGLEYGISTAWYGTTDLASGKVNDTNGVTNHRIAFVFSYIF